MSSLRRRVRFLNKRVQRRVRLWHRRSFGDPGLALSADMESESRTLLITFGGMKSMAGIASFEFVALTNSMPVKRLFVRDPRQSWYHRGMPKHGSSLANVVDALRSFLAAHEVDRLVTVGNSAGGYAALVFGTLLGADAVLSFSPQTVLDGALLAEMGDHRWDDLLAPLVRNNALESHWTDLRDALPSARCADTSYRVFYDETVPGDRAHAENLRGIEGLRLYRFGHGGHTLARCLRDCGALERILRSALELPLDEPAGVRVSAREIPQAQLEFRPWSARRRS